MADYTLLPVSNEDELGRLLNGQVLERLPPGPYEPIAALVDLDLGAGGGSGLGAIRRLRAHPVGALTTVILFTNGLAGRDERDLLAVLAAYANGGGLLASTKDEPDGPRLRTVLKAAEATASAGGVLSPKRSLGGLRYVPTLKLRRRPQPSGHPETWSSCCWVSRGCGRCGRTTPTAGRTSTRRSTRPGTSFPDFLRRGSRRLMPNALADSGRNQRGSGRVPSRERPFDEKGFWRLFLSWHMYGDSFLNVPGPLMEPQGLGDEEEYRQHSARRRLVLGMFFARYGHLLMSREIHAFAEAYMTHKDVP